MLHALNCLICIIANDFSFVSTLVWLMLAHSHAHFFKNKNIITLLQFYLWRSRENKKKTPLKYCFV